MHVIRINNLSHARYTYQQLVTCTLYVPTTCYCYIKIVEKR